jgi:hypothetical protein
VRRAAVASLSPHPLVWNHLHRRPPLMSSSLLRLPREAVPLLFPASPGRGADGFVA